MVARDLLDPRPPGTPGRRARAERWSARSGSNGGVLLMRHVTRELDIQTDDQTLHFAPTLSAHLPNDEPVLREETPFADRDMEA